jgi:predicted permease
MTAVALFGAGGPPELRATPAIALMTADVRPALLVLLAAVALLLATATANTATLQLARATACRRDLAIRAAIGAGAARLTRQLVIDALLLGGVGGGVGVALAVAMQRVLPAVLPPDFPRADAIVVDWRVLAVAVAASLVASVVSGLLPAWHVRRFDLVALLSEDGSAPIGAGLRTRTARVRTLLVAGQLAVSCVLLVGALLLARSFVALLSADRGYDPTNVLTARIAFPSDYSMERRTALLDRVADRLRALPGVREAAYGNALPLLSAGGFRGFKLRPPANPSVEVDATVVQRSVNPGYFRALGLRLVEGRALSATDTASAPEAIVVNRSFAAKYLGARPLGTVVPNLGMCRPAHDRWEVVGVVDDVQQGATPGTPQDEIFLPIAQVGCANALSQAAIVIRTAADPLPYAAALRRAVRDEAPSIAVDSLMTMEDRVMRGLAKPRLYAVVLGGFAGAAVAIAALGLFGVLSYIVAQRSREIGVRTALGARPPDIVRLVLRQVAPVAAAGIGVGLTAAWATARTLTAMLYGIDAHDAASFGAVAVVLALVAAAACAIPARRAARVDPLQAMR